MWAALKVSLFGIETSIPPLIKPDGSITYKPLDKACLLADSFHSKQSREAIELPPTCHPLPAFNSFAFKSSEIRYLLSNLDEHGGTDPNWPVPLFFFL